VVTLAAVALADRARERDLMDYARMRAIADEIMELFPDDIRGIEISGEEIVMMMSPAKRHEKIAWLIQDQLAEQLRGTSAPRLIAHCGVEIERPDIGKMRRPDVTILPIDFDTVGDDEDLVDPSVVEAVVEVVSKSNHSNDYDDKMSDYPAMGIPFYLVVDPRKGTGLVLSDIHSSPEGPRYATRTEFLFGETVCLGPWRVDTSDFPTY
jgi:Uma2 family endonuclease